jgi:glutaminyl-peptide cyclotransferase
MRSFFLWFLFVPLMSACAAEQPPTIDFEIQHSYPHNVEFFTQGLLFDQGRLYESTGQYGESQLIRYADDYSTPRIRRSLDPRFFGEGIALLDNQLISLTWKSGTALIHDPSAFGYLGSFAYQGEGWGLTSDGTKLWMSDGSATLTQRDAKGEVLGTLAVQLDGQPLDRLNELEYVKGLMLANRWYDSHIYAIDLTSGEVVGILDLSELAKPQLDAGSENVLNGIAWNPEHQTLWVTGKNWSELYELSVQLPRP